jgi:hypothetical protein
MKTYRLVNTAEGELPVVGDEVFCQGKDPGEKWYSIPQDELDYFQGTSNFCDRVFRRELHPQEMAKEIAAALQHDFFIHKEIKAGVFEDWSDEEIVRTIMGALKTTLEAKS